MSKRYALILEDPPVSSQFASREIMRSAEAKKYHQQIEARQRSLRNELASRKMPVTGSVSTILNAVFVAAAEDRVSELKSLPGVKGVVALRRYHKALNRAVPLVNGPAAWNFLGGALNAGSGIKIGFLDTGIDQTHPAFQDPALPMPPGYPLCSGGDCDFTSNKVIVARSYVRQLAAGSAPNPAADSRPDDYSARDRDGHGTAVASCAAGFTSTGAFTFSGMAPKAYLGSYKIYGSPQVNDYTMDDVIIQALEDAFKDGMDIVSFSSGGPAFTGPLDSGSACGNDPGVPCDLLAKTFEDVANRGLIIVVAAGNQGDSGNYYPAFSSISSPADAPSVIAVGATTNSHIFAEIVSVPGAGVPPSLQAIPVQSGDAYVPAGSMTAPLRDVRQLGNDGFACSALPAASLIGVFALIERGPAINACSFATKLTNALDAGAVGAIFYMADQSVTMSPGGLSGFGVPAVMISNRDGLALQSFLAANPNRLVTIDPAGIEQSAQGDRLVSFSSFGPSTGDYAIKPELVAVGTSVYMAAESYDPLGELYGSGGYAVADGTSFATPVVAGAAALVKQSHPGFSAAQVKSALVNTTSQDVTTDDSGGPVDVQWLGAGKLDAGAAVGDTITASPATLSFGVLAPGPLPKTQRLQITNSGPAAVNLVLAIAVSSQSSGTTLALDKQGLSLAPGASGFVSVTLSGAVPPAGSYSGAVTIQAPGVSLRVPYLYLVGTGRAANIIPLTGIFFAGTVGEGIPEGIISFKLVDTYGLPMAGAAVSFSSRNVGARLSADNATDANGIAAAQPVLGSQPGNYSFIAVAGGMRLTFSGTARTRPTIAPNGIADAASFDNTNPVAPGSYISIFGTGLSDFTDYAPTATLPLAIDRVNVSFDVPTAGISVPGRLVYVSPNQVNVQVPWELQHASSAQVKVTIDYSNGNVVTLPLSDYAPALFKGSSGTVAGLDLSNRVIGPGNPARGGQTIQLFANGLGPVTNQPETGAPAPASPLAETTSRPVVTIGGQPADVSFSGLAPGFAGLYQINVTVPSSLSPGTAPVSVTIGGRTSRVAGITIQ